MKEPLEFAIVMLAFLVMLIMLVCLGTLIFHYPIFFLGVVAGVILDRWFNAEVDKLQQEIGF